MLATIISILLVAIVVLIVVVVVVVVTTYFQPAPEATLVTEPPRLVGFKQGSGKIRFAFQITQASGLEDGFAGSKTVGRETS